MENEIDSDGGLEKVQLDPSFVSATVILANKERDVYELGYILNDFRNEYNLGHEFINSEGGINFHYSEHSKTLELFCDDLDDQYLTGAFFSGYYSLSENGREFLKRIFRKGLKDNFYNSSHFVNSIVFEKSILEESS